MRLPNSRTLFILIAVAFAFSIHWSPLIGWSGWALSLIGFFAATYWNRLFPGIARREWLERASRSPIVLRPPFEDKWYVAAGGPDPAHNHHTAVSDQYFAYDFLREEGDAWDQPILAPCDGMVVHVENRQEDAPPNERRRDRKYPFGNYISIQTPRGYVILAHLRKGSVAVRVGETVRAGTLVGRCGNSGNTTRANLHLHAQDQPSQSIDVATAIPVAFTDRLRSEPRLLEYKDRLG